MFVFSYLRAIIERAIREWGYGVLIVVGIGPVILAAIYRVVPSFTRDLDDPLLIAAGLWLVVLLFVITPAKVWDEQRRAIEGSEADTRVSGLPDLFMGAQIEHSTMNFYLSDGAGHIVSSAASNTLIRTDEYEAVIYPGGTVAAHAQAAIASGVAHDATVSKHAGS